MWTLECPFVACIWLVGALLVEQDNYTGSNSISTATLQAIHALQCNAPSRTQTRSQNPNPTHVSLDGERGGVKIKISNAIAAGQSNAQGANKSANLVLELPYIAWNHSNCSKVVDLDAYTFSTSTSSVLSAPIILSELSYTLATPPATELAPALPNELDRQFNQLDLSDSVSTKSDTTLATPRDVEPQWAFAANLLAPNNNPTVEEALSGPDTKEWWKAMEKEVSTFENMDTYKLTSLPPGHKVIGNAWVLTLKCNANGTPACYKRRLVAQGFSQRPGINFDKMFVPVVRLNLVCLLLSIANQNNWDI
ncbi:hypothetical protein RSOLAG1IB_07946 [Rhizoctonia solani AG-1 IB]|uniref:Reverse transcriptase Ty1/copia-type domain-containing protein n=1 Tax=Thanatephorus cucumeris (strain AG1-IB / isolate 7/3/14) TaxID=1108050 RepID=A0A0B7FF44_THACB|nr:hypothetical protein RSOLAG1IB_07946 [Rhizoctonia solani AG-1 IB]